MSNALYRLSRLTNGNSKFALLVKKYIAEGYPEYEAVILAGKQV